MNRLAHWGLAFARIITAAAFCSAMSASAAPGISYTYDALGRLVTVCDANDATGDLTTYKYDAAGNRTTYTHVRTEQTLSWGDSILSPNGNYMFIMQSDGNLVLYVKSGASWVPANWSSGSAGTFATHTSFQSDGNLVVYGSTGPVWYSATQSRCARLSVQNDGNVVIKDVGGNVIWSTNTGGH